MRGNGAEPHLHHPQRRHHKEVLDGGALRGSGPEAQQRVVFRQKFIRHGPGLRAKVPDHAAHARQQQNKADDAPHDGAAGGLISNQRFMRPILGVGDVRAGTIGGGGPGRPPEERAHGPQLLRIAQSVGLDRVLIPPAREDVGVVACSSSKAAARTGSTVILPVAGS